MDNKNRNRSNDTGQPLESINSELFRTLATDDAFSLIVAGRKFSCTTSFTDAGPVDVDSDVEWGS